MWNFIGKNNVWCISLISRDDRFKNVSQEFKKVNLFDKVNFHRPKKHKISGKIGCWESHKYCMTKILESDEPYGIIFEDDIVFENNWEEELKYIKEFINISEWDIMYLGCLINACIKPSETIPNKIWKCKCLNAHAYIVKPSFIKRALGDPYFYDNISIDWYYYKKCNNQFCLIDSICYQNNSPSDNKWHKIDLYQKIVQKYTSWNIFQRLNNKIAWSLRVFPVILQKYLNPLASISNIYSHLFS